MAAHDFFTDQIEVGITRVAREQLTTEIRQRTNAGLPDEIRTESLFCLHEKKIVDAISSRTGNHGIGTAQGKIPPALRHAAVVIRRKGRLVKSYVQPFGREKSTILRHQMGRPAVIAGYIKNVQQRTSYVGFFYPLDRRASR